MEQILANGGSDYIMPAVLFALVLYVVRGIFSLDGRRSQNRKEFLELWNTTRSEDDLWLEVAVRHLFGTYLPAPVIRLALEQPDKSKSLLDLSELWSLWRYDQYAHTAQWLHKGSEKQSMRNASRAALIAGYFVGALLAVLAARVASQYGANTFPGWAFGISAVASGFLSLICLMREDTVKVAAAVGDEWLSRINRSAGQPDQSAPKKCT